MSGIWQDNETRPTRLLLAEDVALVRIQIAETLRRAGYIVLEAENGVAAVDCVRDLPAGERPDLAVMDIEMPGLDGLAAGSVLFANYGIRFMLLTGYEEPELIQKAVKAKGCLNYMVKTPDLGSDAGRLVPAIESTLASARLLEDELARGRVEGYLMASLHISKEMAQDLLHTYARSQRQPKTEIVSMLLQEIESNGPGRVAAQLVRMLLHIGGRDLSRKGLASEATLEQLLRSPSSPAAGS